MTLYIDAKLLKCDVRMDIGHTAFDNVPPEMFQISTFFVKKFHMSSEIPFTGVRALLFVENSSRILLKQMFFTKMDHGVSPYLGLLLTVIFKKV